MVSKSLIWFIALAFSQNLQILGRFAKMDGSKSFSPPGWLFYALILQAQHNPSEAQIEFIFRVRLS